MILSVVTVCWNAADTIRDTIESILNQNFQNFEYVVVDGASTDSTYNIVCEYDEMFKKRGISFRHISEKDNGIFDAMNKATSIAKGEWISFINADDKLFDDKVLEKVFFEDISEFDVLYGDVYRVGVNGGYADKASPVANMPLAMPFCHQSSFTKRILLLERHFDTNHIVADYKFFLGLYFEGKKFKKLDITIAQYSTEGFSNQNRYRTYLDVVSVKGEYGLICPNSKLQSVKNLYHKILLDNNAFGHILISRINKRLTEKRKISTEE